MELQKSTWVIKGMQRDLAMSKFSADYSYENFNIRILSTDNNTTFAITNEKGPKEIEGDTIQGTPLGTAVVENKLVLFTVGNKDRIYVITIQKDDNDEEYFDLTLIHEGNLNFDKKYPLETLVDIENNKSKKVYWVDGKNQLRFINIESELNQNLVDFKPELKETCSIEVEKNYTGGEFPNGVIQYFFTLYKKYGQESNIIGNSHLYYMSSDNRGGTADSKNSCSFTIKINIDNIQNYDYLRIYSVHRTSINTIQAAYIVQDINLSNETQNLELEYTDTGYGLEAIDASSLLYKYLENITASTLEAKDNTLFIGNIKSSALNFEEEHIDFMKSLVSINTSYKELEFESPNGVYPYKYNLDKSDAEIKGFKSGDIYRVGIQLLLKDGVYTSVLPVGDKEIDIHPEIFNNKSRLPIITCTISDNDIESIKEKFPNAIGYRYLLAKPLSHNKILAQGVLCPTLFNVEDRRNNSPYSISSWFMRPLTREFTHLSPLGSSDTSKGEIQLSDKSKSINFINLNLNENIVYVCTYTRFYVSSMHAFGAEIKEKDTGKVVCRLEKAARWTDARDYIIKHMGSAKYVLDQETWTNLGSHDLSSDDSPPREYTIEIVGNNISAIEDYIQSLNNYYIDQSILTFHSPDIENVRYDNSNDVKLRIVGAVPITANHVEYMIQSKGSLFNTQAIGKRALNFDHPNISSNAEDLYNAPLWNDGVSTSTYNKRILNYITYAWHRSGSLSDSKLSTKEDGTVDTMYSELKRKIFSNLRFSYRPVYFTNTVNMDISGLKLFDSEETTIEKVDDYIYQGNIDKILTYRDSDTEETESTGYPIYVENYETLIGNDNKVIKGLDPVPIQFKSSEHAVFKLKADDSDAETVLPSFKIGDVEYNQMPGSFNNFLPIYKDNLDTDNKPVVIINLIYDTFKGTTNLPDIHLGKLVVAEFNSNSWLFGKITKTGSNWEIEPITLQPNIEGSLATHIYIEDLNKYYYVESVDAIDEDDLPQHFVSEDGLGGSIYVFEEVEPDVITGTTFHQENIDLADSDLPSDDIQLLNNSTSMLYVAELYRDADANDIYGDNSVSSLSKLSWIVASDTKLFNGGNTTKLFGDTFFMRWDCLKTYPFSNESINNVVDITSFMVETRVNLDATTDSNKGIANNITYTELNHNKINPVYNQEDNMYSYRVLINNKSSSDLPTSIYWSLPKTQGELIDSWTTINAMSNLVLDGNKGTLNSITRYNNELFAFQDTGISQILYNEVTPLSSTEGMPIEIVNSAKVQGRRYIVSEVGCQNKWSMCTTPSGIYFIDSIGKSINRFNGQLLNLSDNYGFHSWINRNCKLGVWDIGDNTHIFKSFYDKKNGDVLFINNEYCLAFSESLNSFSSFYNYNGAPYFTNIEDKGIWIKKGNLSLNYQLWHHNEGNYCDFFGNTYPYYVTVIANQEPVKTKVFTNLEFKAHCLEDDNVLSLSIDSTPIHPYNNVSIWNEYQRGMLNFKYSKYAPSNIKYKLGIYRAQLPRANVRMPGFDYKPNNRILGNWAFIKLQGKSSNRAVLHNMILYYYNK